jgi:hypothetical protein
MRTARSRTSGEYLVVLFITPSSQEMESPVNPGRFSKSKPLSFEFILEKTVLFDEIINDRLLLAVEPAGQSDYKALERLYSVFHCTSRLSATVFDNKIIRLVRIFAPDAMIAPK